MGGECERNFTESASEGIKETKSNVSSGSKSDYESHSDFHATQTPL